MRAPRLGVLTERPSPLNQGGSSPAGFRFRDGKTRSTHGGRGTARVVRLRDAHRWEPDQCRPARGPPWSDIARARSRRSTARGSCARASPRCQLHTASPAAREGIVSFKPREPDSEQADDSVEARGRVRGLHCCCEHRVRRVDDRRGSRCRPVSGAPRRVRPDLLLDSSTEPDLSLDAIAALEAAARREPLSPLAREALGTAYFRLGRWEDAEAEFLSLVDLSPSDDFAYYALGRTLAKQGRQWEAARQFKLAGSFSDGGISSAETP
jgi:tetratricopeptide (TPR) repeat protein